MIVAALLLLANATAPMDLARIQPEVHSATEEGDELVIRSAGISRIYLGPLQSSPRPAVAPREYEFRLPRAPHAALLQHPGAPPEIRGVFLNGVPVYNQFQDSYQAQNIWHYDPLAAGDAHANTPGVLEQTSTHTLVGYALDGFPIYADKRASSYQLRHIRARTTLADGTALTPAQYGPAVDAENPLGRFAEDYEYVAGSGELDEFNGRRDANGYAYFLSTRYPYLLADRYYGELPHRAAPAHFVASSAGMTLRSDVAAAAKGAAAGVPIHLSFTGPANLEYVHERPIHLLVVSDDLAEFAHVHPEFTGDAYELTYTFAHGGHYRAYADFTPPGSEQRIASFDFDVAGPPRTRERIAARAIPGVTLKSDAPLRAGRDIPLRLAIADRDGMEPYLGAWSHFVVIGEGLSSFQHAHPINETTQRAMKGMAHCAMATGAPPAEVRTVVNFAAPGTYKLWAQFQRRGEVVTVPFVLRVRSRFLRAGDPL